MNSISITKIKTGRGLGGSRIGLIFAPPYAPPGSMTALTEFLNEQPGIRARPGYHGPNENPVLRISGLSDDRTFLRLLQQQFPEWQNEQADESVRRLKVADDIICEPLDEVDHFPHQPYFARMVKENANTLSALAYSAGSVALLLAGWRQQKGSALSGKPAASHDWPRVYSSASYFTAAAILGAMSQITDNPRDVYSIMESVYPPLIKQTAGEKALAEEKSGAVLQFVRNHPWEISMLLNASGAGAHAFSAARRHRQLGGRRIEMVSALATLTACALSAVIPEKGGRSMVPIHDWVAGEDGKGVSEQLEDFALKHPFAQGFVNRANAVIDWVQDNPLKLAAGVSAVANVGYFAAGIRNPNVALSVMGSSFLLGNYAQSQATKGRGPGFDDVVTAAAAIMEADPNLKGASSSEIYARARQLAGKLVDQREIVHNKDRLIKGTIARLKRDGLHNELKNADSLEEFLTSEKRLLAKNPFADPLNVHRMQPEKPNAPDASQSPGIA